MRVAYSAFLALFGQSIKSSLIVRRLLAPMYPLSLDRRHRCDPNDPGCRAVRVGQASRVWQDQREGGHRSAPGQASLAATRAASHWPRLVGYTRLGIPPETPSVRVN